MSTPPRKGEERTFNLSRTRVRESLNFLIMSKGSFKVIGELSHNTCHLYEKEHDRYIMTAKIDMVDKHPTYFSDMNYGDEEADAFHDGLKQRGLLNCKIVHDSSDRNPNNGHYARDICLDKLGLYIITTKKYGDFVVDPCEKEHMERVLAGTDDPLYDLVHELRYNPTTRLGKDVQEAESHFKKSQTE